MFNLKESRMQVKQKNTNKLLIISFLLFLIVIVLILFNINKLVTKKSLDTVTKDTRALFSWKSEEVDSTNSLLFEIMDKQEINTLYQEFSRDLSQEAINDFLFEGENNKIDIYYLTGEPEWALDKTGKSMIDHIDRVVELNNNLKENSRIKGIVFDIEPYSLDEWKNKEKVMDDFVIGMEVAYKHARDNNIEVILCIPYFYDNKGLTKQLEELIKSGCDSIAIMNYSKGNEIENMNLEVEFAALFNKKIINIYELQPPGTRDLTEKNTYYNQGVEAIENNFQDILDEFYGKDISVAFHEYNSLKEVLGYE